MGSGRKEGGGWEVIQRDLCCGRGEWEAKGAVLGGGGWCGVDDFSYYSVMKMSRVCVSD